MAISLIRHARSDQGGGHHGAGQNESDFAPSHRPNTDRDVPHVHVSTMTFMCLLVHPVLVFLIELPVVLEHLPECLVLAPFFQVRHFIVL